MSICHIFDNKSRAFSKSFLSLSHTVNLLLETRLYGSKITLFLLFKQAIVLNPLSIQWSHLTEVLVSNKQYLHSKFHSIADLRKAGSVSMQTCIWNVINNNYDNNKDHIGSFKHKLIYIKFNKNSTLEVKNLVLLQIYVEPILENVALMITTSN